MINIPEPNKYIRYMSISSMYFEQKLEKDATFYLAIFLSCLFIVGVPILFFPANDLNIDAFQHLATANYYLYAHVTSLRDSYTVGPVISLLIASVKGVFYKFIDWNGRYDIFLLKGLSFFCYLTIYLSAGKFLKRSTSNYRVYLFLVLMMGLHSYNSSIVSINGELLSITWMTLLLNYLYKDDNNPNSVIVSLLTILTIYTKIQSVLLLILTLTGYYHNKKEKWAALLTVLVITLFVEIILFFNGTGLLHRAHDFISYVLNPNWSHQALDGNSHSILFTIADNRYIKNALWVAGTMIKTAPLIVFVIYYHVRTSKNNQTYIAEDWRIWLLILFVTVLTPGHRFKHYTLYAMFFVIVFSKPMLADFSNKLLSRRWASSLAIAMIFIGLNTVRTLLPIEKTELKFPQEVNTAAEITKKGGGRVFIHGWNYKLYTVFHGWDDGTALWKVYQHNSTPEQYINRVINNHDKYILDVAGYSGMLKEHNFEILPSTIYGKELLKYYDLIFQKNGLRLYRAKLD